MSSRHKKNLGNHKNLLRADVLRTNRRAAADEGDRRHCFAHLPGELQLAAQAGNYVCD